MGKPLLAALAAVQLAACAAAPGGKSNVSLLETYWKAVQLEGAPVEAGPGQREAHLILRRENSAAAGFSGCNNVRGAYELAGNSLRFKQMATTLMACLPGAADTEQRYNAALAASAEYRINGDNLELRDREGKVRARFSAVYLR
jgi:heat shock protein HslJ